MAWTALDSETRENTQTHEARWAQSQICINETEKGYKAWPTASDLTIVLR